MFTHSFPQYFVVIALSDISPLKEFLICKKTHFDVVLSASVDLFLSLYSEVSLPEDV